MIPSCRPSIHFARLGCGLATLALLTLPADAAAATVLVPAGDNLQLRIDRASGGDVLLLASGTYAGFQIRDRHFTEAQPLVLKAAPGAKPVILGSNFEGYLAKLSNSSYVVFDGLTFENSNQPIYGTTVDHFLFLNLEIHHTGQEAIHFRGQSHHIDIRNCRIYDTGHFRAQWSEGIYLGMGQPPFEAVEHVWIEGNDISRTGHSEAINLKSRSYHVTIRGNKVHDLAPGTATQHNQAAISCEAADLAFRPGEDTDLWIEHNEISDVRFGRWANGIQATSMGPRILHNHIHDCAQFGIDLNAHGTGPGAFPTWIHGNTIERCAAGDLSSTTLVWKDADPGPNPNQPQTWYRSEPAGPP